MEASTAKRQERVSSVIRIVLLEALPVIGEALQLFLATQPDFDAIAVTDVGEFLMSIAAASLVLVSLEGLPTDPWRLLRRVRQRVPDARIAILASEQDPDLVTRAFGDGADGFLHMRADPVAFLDG